jgi:hypothetical protein
MLTSLDRIDVLEVEAREYYDQPFHESTVLKEARDKIFLHQFGELEIHATEVGNPILRIKTVTDFFHASGYLININRVRRRGRRLIHFRDRLSVNNF